MAPISCALRRHAALLRFPVDQLCVDAGNARDHQRKPWPIAANAIVVNSARGEIVDDDALIDALKSGRVAAAGLDVFKGEPNIDPRYRELDNVFLLPHLGSATHNTRIAMGMRAVDNLDAFFSGERRAIC